MIRIHQDSIVPRYLSGNWSWNVNREQLNFSSWKNEVLEREKYVETASGYKFKARMNQMEELIFRQEFASNDFNATESFITIQDIKNLVLFLAPADMLTKTFVNFIHTESVDRFLNALIIYFEYFLRLVEFILIRRDETFGKSAQLESIESTKIKRIYSGYLTQYRILLAREYSWILMGNDEMEAYYHCETLMHFKKTSSDRKLYEFLLAFATQVVWIAHHRRAFDVIDGEMNRLFRSDHFKLTHKDAIRLSKIEKQLLYGQFNELQNFRRQKSPLVQEIVNVQRKNLHILWIGKKKYRGNDLRTQQLELEFIVPDGDLSLIDVKHGILGNPTALYNTMLEIVWDSVRKNGYSNVYDPYQIIRQPCLEVPKFDALEIMTPQHLEAYFTLKDAQFMYDKELIKKWKRRDQIIEYIRNGGLVIDVIEKCKKQLERKVQTRSISVVGITEAFIAKNKLLRKHRQKFQTTSK